MNIRILIVVAGLAGSFAAHADCSSSWSESTAATERARETYDRENWEAASPQLAQAMASWRQTAQGCTGEDMRRATRNAETMERWKAKADNQVAAEKRRQTPCGLHWDTAEDALKKFWKRMSAEAADAAADFWQLASVNCTGADAKVALEKVDLLRTTLKRLAVARAAQAASAASAAGR